MCFVTFDTALRVAKRDILVYKIGSATDYSFVSDIKGYEYMRDAPQERVKLVNVSNETDHVLIEEGYHSYKDCKPSCYYTPSEQGLFIIPKGSTYYESTNEIVSDRIVYVGRCTELRRLWLKLLLILGIKMSYSELIIKVEGPKK